MRRVISSINAHCVCVLRAVHCARRSARVVSSVRLGTDPAVAVPARAARRSGRPRRRHCVDRPGRRVPHDRPGSGGRTLGPAQEQGEHELRQDGPRHPLLLRQMHPTQDRRQEVHVPLQRRRSAARERQGADRRAAWRPTTVLDALTARRTRFTLLTDCVTGAVTFVEQPVKQLMWCLRFRTPEQIAYSAW